MNIMTDYLAVGGLLLARLRSRLPDLRVASTWGLSEIREYSGHDQILVLLEKDVPGESASRGYENLVTQRWCVVVVVRDAQTEAGVIISKVINAIAGWKPEVGGFSPFQREVSSHNPDWTAAGFYYFPVAFATSFVFRGEK